MAHYLNVIEDRTVEFHRLTDAVFQCFKWDAEFKAMLYEGLTGGVVTDMTLYSEKFRSPVQCEVYIIKRGTVSAVGNIEQVSCLWIHIEVDKRIGFDRDSELDILVCGFLESCLVSDVADGFLFLIITEVIGDEVYEVDATEIVGKDEEVNGTLAGLELSAVCDDATHIFNGNIQLTRL